MPKLEKSHVVRHRAEDMFDLVCDVECYPEFVPLCQAISVTTRKEKDAKSLINADMTMAYGKFSETFSTNVMMNREELTIDVRYIEGPFKHLINHWHFEPLGVRECRVHFMVDYELRSKILAMAAGSVFDLAFGKFVSAFEERADKVYGTL